VPAAPAGATTFTSILVLGPIGERQITLYVPGVFGAYQPHPAAERQPVLNAKGPFGEGPNDHTLGPPPDELAAETVK
jgi:hypothetical protein